MNTTVSYFTHSSSKVYRRFNKAIVAAITDLAHSNYAELTTLRWNKSAQPCLRTSSA